MTALWWWSVAFAQQRARDVLSRWRLAVAWCATVIVAATVGAGAATYGILAHGTEIGEPLIVLGGKLTAAAEPVIVQEAATILPLPGELDTPMPTPAARRAATRKDAGTKLARR